MRSGRIGPADYGSSVRSPSKERPEETRVRENKRKAGRERVKKDRRGEAKEERGHLRKDR